MKFMRNCLIRKKNPIEKLIGKNNQIIIRFLECSINYSKNENEIYFLLKGLNLVFY